MLCVDNLHLFLVLNSTYAESVLDANYRRGTGPVHYGFIHCRGTEESATRCRIIVTSYCGHRDDLGIKCGEGTVFLCL